MKITLNVKINYPNEINFSSFYHPFRCETKSFYIKHVDNLKDADIVYNNIYDYTDVPTSAYDNKDLILIPHPLYEKDVNEEYNIVVVPLVMHEQDKIIFDNAFLSECRKNSKRYEYGYIGDIYEGRLELKDLEFDSYFFKDGGLVNRGGYSIDPQRIPIRKWGKSSSFKKKNLQRITKKITSKWSEDEIEDFINSISK